MKFGEYDVALSPLGWLALAAAAAANAVAPGKGFRRQSSESREGNSMAYKLTVFIVNPDDEQIYVEHNFYGATRAAAEHVKKEHLGSCEYFSAAEEEGRTAEEGEEISDEDWPVVGDGGRDTDDDEDDDK
jgi:hypothetical protein